MPKTYLPDVNIWLALAFDGHAHHRLAKPWFDALSDDGVCFCRLTQQGFLLLATIQVPIGTTMAIVVQPWHLIVGFLASWINREQAEVIDYLRTENQVLKEKLGPRHILLTDDQRPRLAVKGKVLGRRRLEEIGTRFTPDTILRWRRMLVAQKWDYSAKRGKTGRPLVDTEITSSDSSAR